MRTEYFSFQGYHDAELSAVLWLPEEEPKQILQIVHGMTEHMGRYTALAEELTAQGIGVAGFDLPGHGKNPGDLQVASLGEEGWKASVEDIRLFFDLLAQRFPKQPHYLLGFSLGSFLLREYLAGGSKNIAGAVIMGTGWQPGIVLRIMKMIVKCQIKKAGFDQTTPLVRQLSFGTYNQKCRPNRTSADWLCADEKQIDKYLDDSLCREDISAGLFWQLLDSMERTGKASVYESWNKNLPILLLSGQEDPVGDAGKGVETVKKQMEAAGIRHLKMQLFAGARHDLLHEESCGAAGEARRLIGEWIRGQK